MSEREAPGLSLAPEPMREAEVQAQLDDIDVDAPRVGIVMGSKSDMEAMEKAARELANSSRSISRTVRRIFRPIVRWKNFRRWCGASTPVRSASSYATR